MVLLHSKLENRYKFFKAKFMSYNNIFSKITGTSLKGVVDTTYSELVEAFGKPVATSFDCDKIDAMWVLETPSGVATIYNYKDGVAYCGASGMKVQDIKEWHVGGVNMGVVNYVEKSLSV